jgi:hypothetical protein
VGLLRSLVALVRLEVPVRDLDPVPSAGLGAYDLVDELPRGPARAAAWNAFVLQTYADKLCAAGQAPEYVRADTAAVVDELYRLAALWLDRASELAANPARSAWPALPDRLPHWHTPVRSETELVGMRETLDALHTYLAYDLRSVASQEAAAAGAREQLSAIEAELETAARLWIRRAPPELRGGVGDALASGLDQAYELGRLLARGLPVDGEALA